MTSCKYIGAFSKECINIGGILKITQLLRPRIGWWIFYGGCCSKMSLGGENPRRTLGFDLRGDCEAQDLVAEISWSVFSRRVGGGRGDGELEKNPRECEDLRGKRDGRPSRRIQPCFVGGGRHLGLLPLGQARPGSQEGAGGNSNLVFVWVWVWFLY